MFTGIVECIGTVSALDKHDDTADGGGGTSLTISDAENILGDAKLGDSISVNGTCLTITSFTKSTFKVGISPETLRRTNLGSLEPVSASTPSTASLGPASDTSRKSRVDLERAVSATTRMGGHFVQGHVDTTASIGSVEPDGNALTFRLRPRDQSVMRFIVKKGYVTLDGASLTVTTVDDAQGWWEVMLVAYTQEKIVMGSKQAGDDVNVEVDMLGKYVDKSVQAYFDGLRSQEQQRAEGLEGARTSGILEKMVERIVDEHLKR